MTPRRILSLALIAGLLAAIPLSSAGAARRVRVMDCKGGSCWPTAFAFTPNGRKIFYVERFSGEIRVKDLKTKKDRRWFRIGGVATEGEQGMLGLALDPRWPKKKNVFVYHTNRSPFQNRILRLRKQGGKTRRHRILTLGANGNHNGGVIHFGPDGMLYAVTGDLGSPSNSQNTSHPAGKVLRMTKNGKRPASNPFGGSKAWSYGHRNSFGFAFDPETGNLWQTENGPECEDEINLVVKGGNYGWGGGSNCPGTSTEGPGPRDPERAYTPVIAPTGAAFCDGCKLGGATQGTLLFGSVGERKIRRLTLDAQRDDVAGEAVIYSHGRFILALIAAPDGRVYFSDPYGIYRLRR